jgi:hypothetical protein
MVEAVDMADKDVRLIFCDSSPLPYLEADDLP